MTAGAPASRRFARLPVAWRDRSDWVPVDTTLGQVLRGVRWAAVGTYFFVLVYNWHRYGVPFDRDGLLLWIAVGLACSSIGKHPVWLLWVAIDFVPFALVLVAYDYLRGISDKVGMPTWWTPQVDLDKWLFFGNEPTVWLQEHLKRVHYDFTGHAWVDIEWYDVVVCLTYYSFFFLPYVVAGVMWLRKRVDFYRWSLRFVSLSFLAFLLFMLIPTAPPWAADHCRAVDVASHPRNPPCMFITGPAHGLLGSFTTHQPGASPWVERIDVVGFYKLHLGVAHTLWTKGFSVVDSVAAVPSLHVGATVLFSLFMWKRLNKWWRPLLIGYPLLMQFALTYGGEHYVVDGIAGGLCAWLVHSVANRLERRRAAQAAPDTLDTPPEATLESECPPTHPLPETTPSST